MAFQPAPRPCAVVEAIREREFGASVINAENSELGSFGQVRHDSHERFGAAECPAAAVEVEQLACCFDTGGVNAYGTDRAAGQVRNRIGWDLESLNVETAGVDPVPAGVFRLEYLAAFRRRNWLRPGISLRRWPIARRRGTLTPTSHRPAASRVQCSHCPGHEPGLTSLW